jgi:ribA/ribD-fused uncharacterized protein
MNNPSSIEVIDSFSGEYRFLSNFFPSPITVKDLHFPTVEHAFQFMKLPEDVKCSIMLSDTENKYMDFNVSAKEIKRVGRNNPLRDDWDIIKVFCMYAFVRLKFIQNKELKALLLQTGNSLLVEGNKWGDNIWGVCKNSKSGEQGLNLLGRILMLVRDELRMGVKNEKTDNI